MGKSLKEFDKWSGKEYYTYDALCRTDAMKLAWKAALEWVVKTTDEHYYAFEDKFDVIKMIKEELNAKT